MNTGAVGFNERKTAAEYDVKGAGRRLAIDRYSRGQHSANNSLQMGDAKKLRAFVENCAFIIA
jgi:hypothetical protein